MIGSPFSRRALAIIALGVALPAMILAGLAIYLSLRISSAIEAQSRRYTLYMARQMAEGFEQELMAHLREAIGPAENVARTGGDDVALATTLAANAGEFGAAQMVPLENLADYLLLVVESQPLVYGAEERPGGLHFAGMMLRDPTGQVTGAGGWWMDPRVFLLGHLRMVMEERVAANPRIYGGVESTRNLSVMLVGLDGREVARVRDPAKGVPTATEPLAGPFEGYAVRVAATQSAPAAWTPRFVLVEVAFIAIMAMLIMGASLFGVRYTVRQLELARIKSSFVSNVSHELKTPISLIRLAVETLEMRRFTSPEESQKFLARISRETMRLNQLVDNILDFARLEAGQRPFRFAPVDVNEVVRETVDSFRLRVEDQGFALSMDLPESVPPVRGDGPAIAQCLLNLLDNAIKYSRQRREIRVAVGVRNAEVTISVSDRGIGIAPRDQRKIFEKFVRLETGLVHDVKGAGLGLSLVDQIMKAHGGRIEVSSALGEGSTFTLVLPAAAAVDEPRVEPEVRTAS